jgi:hypothetical protein
MITNILKGAWTIQGQLTAKHLRRIVRELDDHDIRDSQSLYVRGIDGIDVTPHSIGFEHDQGTSPTVVKGQFDE